MSPSTLLSPILVSLPSTSPSSNLLQILPSPLYVTSPSTTHPRSYLNSLARHVSIDSSRSCPCGHAHHTSIEFFPNLSLITCLSSLHRLFHILFVPSCPPCLYRLFLCLTSPSVPTLFSSSTLPCVACPSVQTHVFVIDSSLSCLFLRAHHVSIDSFLSCFSSCPPCLRHRLSPILLVPHSAPCPRHRPPLSC